ncbi:MAG: hypothetical protein K2X66_16080, partial [Cyanobacteria bacterium]|nr:hypothetical protein [Cyanobacteriota bacterium]
MKLNPHPYPYKLLFLGHINLKQKYWYIRQEAENLAEKPENIINRSVRMHSIYQDSKKNYRHAEMVSHGGLWAYPLFNFHKSTLAKTAGALLSPVSGLKEQLMGSLKSFCEGLQYGN